MAEHSTLTGTDLHEPKGASSALVGQVYVADGSGGGAWTSPPMDTHGEMAIVNNTSINITPPSASITDFTKVTGASLWTLEHAHGVTFSVDQLTVPNAGTYHVNMWMSFTTSAATGTKFAVKYYINGVTASTRTVTAQKNSTGSDVLQISASGLAHSLSASDTISLYLASDATTVIEVNDAGLTVLEVD